jgi:outer membrane lipoprotein-sorting protein
MRIAALAITLMMAFQAGAQTDEAAKAKEILNKVSAKTKQYQSIKADFSFELENLQDKIKETQDGSILLKGGKYRITLMGVVNYYDGKTLATWMKDAGEVNISEPDMSDETMLNPANIFTIYEKGFKLKYIGEKTIAGKTMYEIDLYPEDRNKPFSRVKLMINKEAMQIHSFMQQGKDGNNYTITLKKMETNVAAADSDFVFNKSANPKVQVIDLR